MGGFGSQACLGCLHTGDGAVTPAVMVFLPEEIVADPDLFRRVWTETRVGTQIDHVNVIAVMGLAQLEEGYARVVEYVDAESMRSVFRRAATLKRPLSPAIACALVADAAFGVHYAHELGTMEANEPIIHGGVRPETLQVGFKGVGKVTGYGATTIAEVARRARRDTGRDAYTAPEQAYGGRAAATVQTDVYALGCVFYEALTGKPPFPADSDLAEAMMRDELARPQHAGITEAMRAVVLRATRKKSSERFASALELRQAILETCVPASERMIAESMRELFPPDAVPRVTRTQLLAQARAAPPAPTGAMLDEIPLKLVRPHISRPAHLSDTEVEAAQGRLGPASQLPSAARPVPEAVEGAAAAGQGDEDGPSIFEVPTVIPELVEDVPSEHEEMADEAEDEEQTEHAQALHDVGGGEPADDEVTDRVARPKFAPRGMPAAAFPTTQPTVVYRTPPVVLVGLGVSATVAFVGMLFGVATYLQVQREKADVTAAPDVAATQKASAPEDVASTAPSSPSMPASPSASPPTSRDTPDRAAAAGVRPSEAREAPPPHRDDVRTAPASRMATAAPAAPARLVLRATPSAMILTVNGTSVGTGSATWEGKAGPVRVVARDPASGAQVTRTVKLRSGETTTLELELALGTLTFDQLADGLEVLVDGKRIGKTPLAAIELVEGRHRIDVKKGGATVTINGVVVAGRELYITAEFQDR